MSESLSNRAITDKNIQLFFVEEDPVIAEQCKLILTQYSGIPESELVSHIRKVRDQAWTRFRYPCIGRYGFLEFSIGDHPLYPELLTDLKHGATLLDLGCCVGQDLRKLVYDGAPATNLTGSELDPEFVAIGYELFRDRDRLNVVFKTGDFFATDTAGLKPGTYDYIQASSFFHLFSWDEQVEAMSKCARLLKQKPGSKIFGRQVGTQTPGEIEQITARSSKTYRHDDASFIKLVGEVSQKTGIPLHARSTMAEEQRLSGACVPGISTRMVQRYSVTINSL